jgi:hypothetical protein
VKDAAPMVQEAEAAEARVKAAEAALAEVTGRLARAREALGISADG